MTSIIVLACLSDQKYAGPGEIKVYLSYILFIYTCLFFLGLDFFAAIFLRPLVILYKNQFS